MAYELSRNRISVGQTLHGYSEGHRLVGGSVKLPQPDARMMLMLSDASANGARIPTNGYLTGYPLAEEGKYVLARTWSAPEMSRPGCVWTHSLLVDFSDLARIAAAQDLLQLFRRPEYRNDPGYTLHLNIDLQQSPDPVPHRLLTRARQLIAGLYARPKTKILAERSDATDDELTVAIWLQQWPRLRRTFRFCTFTAGDRSTAIDAFDLQLMDGGRGVRSRIPETTIATSVEQSDWVDRILLDLEQPSKSEFRRFLRDVGADLTNGRAAMTPLTRLYLALEPSSNRQQLVEAISELQNLGPTQGRMGRAATARAVFSRPDLNDPILFDFALNQAMSDRDLLSIEPGLVGRALLRWKPKLLSESREFDSALTNAVNVALSKASFDELFETVRIEREAAQTISVARPEILERPDFWRLDFDAVQMIRDLSLSPDYIAIVVDAIIQAGRDECAAVTTERWGTRVVLRSLIRYDAAELSLRHSWLQHASRNLNELAGSMVSGDLGSRPLLISLAQRLDPDSVPNSFGTDPWLIAYNNTELSNDCSGEDDLAALLFSRACGYRSLNSGQLFVVSAQRVHDATASRRISDEAWHRVSQRVPRGSIWTSWDRCKSLRHGIVDCFVERDLPPADFAQVVQDENLWIELIDIASDTSRGRKYLERVRVELRSHENSYLAHRSKIIGKMTR